MTSVQTLHFDLTYYPVAVVSCVFFLLVFHYVSPVVSRRVFPGLINIPAAKQTYWHASVCSTVHSVIVSCICVYCVLYDQRLYDDPIWGSSGPAKANCAVVIGYMSADTIIMFLHSDQIGDVNTFLHHATSVTAYVLMISYSVYCYFANFRLTAEISTPFVNNRWFLDTMGKKTSKVYLINGLALTAVFFVCRILTMPWCWYRIYSIYGTEPFNRTSYIKYMLILTCGALDVLNVLWFYKLIKGVRKQMQKYSNAH